VVDIFKHLCIFEEAAFERTVRLRVVLFGQVCIVLQMTFPHEDLTIQVVSRRIEEGRVDP
jgi:hypothetical protein